MLHRALKMWFWVTYDHLGSLLALNLACALPIALLLGLGMTRDGWASIALLYAAFAVASPAAIAALGAVARALIERQAGAFQAFRTGVWLFGFGGAFIGGLGSLLAVVSFIGIYYYLFMRGSPAPLYAYALGGICAWAGMIASTITLFALAALPQKRAGAIDAVRTGALLVADNPVYCLVITLHCAALAACAMVLPVFLLFSVAPIATLLASAYEMLSRKYAAPIVDGKRQITFNDETDDYLNRGLRDFFFPWKM